MPTITTGTVEGLRNLLAEFPHDAPVFTPHSSSKDGIRIAPQDDGSLLLWSDTRSDREAKPLSDRMNVGE